METTTLIKKLAHNIKPGDYIVNADGKKVKIKDVCISEVYTIVHWYDYCEASYMYNNDDLVWKFK